jgi:hypothetical protein
MAYYAGMTSYCILMSFYYLTIGVIIIFLGLVMATLVGVPFFFYILIQMVIILFSWRKSHLRKAKAFQ